ncbi:hypothetical protein D3C73_1270550 [compost metagenome]
MQAIGFVLFILELPGHPAHILGAVGMGYQHRVGGVDDDQVIHTHGRDQAVIALDEVVVAVDENRFADGAVVLCIRWNQRGHRPPGADVAPVETGRHHDHFVGALHQRVIDGNVHDFAKQGR